MKKNNFDYFSLIVFALSITLSFGVGKKIGSKSGFTEGALKTKSTMEKAYEDDIAYYKTQSESAWQQGNNYGVATAEKDCDDQLRIGKAIRSMDVEKAYKQGAMDAIRHISIKCGKK